MNKEGLRGIYRRRRNELLPQQLSVLSQQIASRFFTDARILACLANSNVIVHTYLSIRQQQEVDTWPLIHRLWRNYPGVRIWSSITEPKNNRLIHFQLTADTVLTESKWGIPVPSGTYERVSGQPNLVVVPLLAFDRQGNRVGYGGGYYDRFLAETGPECLKIGLSMFEPVDHIENLEETDVCLDGCITPGKGYWFG